MKITKEIEEYINLTITEHMGKSYTVWKLKQQTEVEPDEVEKAYKKVVEVGEILLSIGTKRRNAYL